MTGSDGPSTLGGSGWLDRTAAHEEEVAAGRVWTPCGYRSEWEPLRVVLLAWPPDSFATVRDPAEHLMLRRIDLAALRAQTEAVAEAFRGAGVEVVLADVPPDCPPNVVFMRDLFFMTPQGAVLARTASAQRAGEERHAAAALAGAGYPILRTPTGTATFEGADALWLDDRTVAVGVGFRTNRAGARTVAEALAEQCCHVVPVPLGRGVQHLLGTVVPLDERLAALHAAAATPELRRALRERDYRLVELPPDADLEQRRGMNVVVLGPRDVLMPAGAPSVRRRLEAVDVRVREVAIGEYLAAAGGLGCVTGILHRSSTVD